MAAPQQNTVPATEARTIERITAAMSITKAEQSHQAPTFTTIPTEVRVRILQEVVTFSCPLQFVTRKSAGMQEFCNLRERPDTAILLCNKQLYYEARPELFRQNTFTFDPTDHFNTLPPYALDMIQHLKIKLTKDNLRMYLRGCYVPFPYFHGAKTVTLCCSKDAAQFLIDVVRDPLHQMYRCMTKTAVSEVVVEDVEDDDLVGKIKELCVTLLTPGTGKPPAVRFRYVESFCSYTAAKTVLVEEGIFF